MAAWRNKLISWKWSSFLLPVRGTATIGRLKDSKTDAKDAEQSVDPNTGYLKSLSNKNPRNLEYLAVAPKPKGFKTLKQRVDFYYRYHTCEIYVIYLLNDNLFFLGLTLWPRTDMSTVRCITIAECNSFKSLLESLG
jgi:hypothetical protein